MHSAEYRCVKSIINLKNHHGIRLAGLVLIMTLATFAFVRNAKTVFGNSTNTSRFKRLDFQAPGYSGSNQNELGRYFLSFDRDVTASMVKDAAIPLFYVDILGAQIDANPFLMNFPHGPAKMVRLNQISETPKVVRATFFLRKSLVPRVVQRKKAIEISFSEDKTDNSDKRSSFSLIPPAIKKAPENKAKEMPGSSDFAKKNENEPMRINVTSADPVALFTELARKSGQMVHFRDPVLKKVEVDIQAVDSRDAIKKISDKMGLSLSEEDGDYWISNSKNPILKIPESFRVEGVDLSGMALGDVLRALGQIAEINIVLDSSMQTVQEKPVQMYLRKMTVRRAFETLLKLNKLALDEIDEKTLLVLTRSRAIELEGKVVRVITPKIPIETIKALTEKSVSSDLKDRYSINEDLGNLVLVGDKDSVDSVETLISSIERKILNAGEGASRGYFQPLNTKPEDLISLTKESLSENENVKITHDKRTDTLLLTGSAESVKRAEELMKKIDKPRTQQALIHIRLIEIHRTDLEEIGIKLPSTLASTDNIGHIKPTNYIIPAEFVAYLENSKVKTLANPTLRCMDKEESTIDISEQIPVKNTVTEYLPVASASLAARTSDNWTTSEIGIKMNVTPFIHQNNEISMEVDIDQTELVSLVEGHPWTARRQIKTKVRVKDKETVVIGGLIRSKKDKSRKPVPLVSKIPILRKLFRHVEHRNNNEEKTEMVVLITPTVVGTGKDDKHNISMTKRLPAPSFKDFGD